MMIQWVTLGPLAELDKAFPSLLQAPAKAIGSELLVMDLSSGKNYLVQRDDNTLNTHLL